MSSVVISGDTSGTCTLQAPAVAGSTVLTLPAQTGTVMVNGPAFSAYASGATACANSTWTKLQINTEEFDTNSNFDTSNYRFTPTVAGYYQINGSVGWGAPVIQNSVSIYKNGSVFKYGYSNGNSGNTYGTIVSALVYFNGSTDYVELYTIQSTGSSQNALGSSLATYFQASMVRSA